MHQLAFVTLLLSATTQIQDGSLIVLKNSNKPIAQVTGSRITHVALIFNHGDAPWVYEATPAVVRRISLTDYCAELSRLRRSETDRAELSILEPRFPYSELQVQRMRKKVRSQLGRRYSVKGYVRGREFDGIHCSHLAAETLETSGRFQFDEEYAISPGELVARVSPLHKSPATLSIKPMATNKSWCEQSWTTWFNYGAWCRWACYETWTFCW